MLWLTWQMWILLALAFAGGVIAGWVARGRSDEAEKGRARGEGGTEAGGTETRATGVPGETGKKTTGAVKEPLAAQKAETAPKPADIPRHAEGEATRGSQAGPDPVAVGAIAPSAPEEPEAGVRRETRDKAVSTGDDELTQIRGLGPKAAEKLREAGVTTISQIARWEEEEIDRYDKLISGRGRIRRDNWVGQAQDIVGGTPAGELGRKRG